MVSKLPRIPGLRHALILLLIGAASFANPQEPDPRMRAGMAALDMGEWQRAARLFATIVDSEEVPPAAWLYLGMARWRAGMLEEAVTALNEATWRLPRSAEASLFLGLVQFELQLLPAAREALTRAASLDPTSAAARLGLARVHLNLAKLEHGIGEVEVAAALEPDNAAIHMTRALLAFRGGDVERAESSARRALELSPDDPEAHALLADLGIQRQRFEEARRHAERLVEMRETDPRARYLLAGALSGLGRREAARAQYETYAALRDATEERDGGMAMAGSGGARVPDRTRRRAVAMSLLQKADAARLEGDVERADLLARIATGIDAATRDAALRVMGLIRYDRDDFAGAAEMMRELWDRGRRSASLAHDLSLALIQSGEPAAAAELLAERLSDAEWAGADDPVLHYLMATGWLEAGRHREAVAAALGAVELDPEAPGPHLVLSRAYEALGRSEEAERARARFEELLRRR